MVRLGILGAGRIAHSMAQTLIQMQKNGCHSVRLYAVAARDLGRAAEFARTYGIEKAWGSYEEMLQDPALDLVYIATPHSHHYRHAMLCLNHGKHVLCEKAFTVNASQAKALVAKAQDKGLLLTEAIWTRYQPMRTMLLELLDSGCIGTPRMLTANLCYAITDKARMVEPELAGGALLDVGVYPLNFAEMVFGRADHVTASCVKTEKGVDLCESITLTWNDGKMAVLNAGMHCISDRQGVIYGSDGFITVENINNPQYLRLYDSAYQLVKEIPCPGQLTGYEYEVLEAAQCIGEGKIQCPSMPHAETIHMMELMDEIRRQFGVVYPCE